MSTKKQISVIKASLSSTGQPLDNKVKIRVCAYARVSTDSDEQLHSLETQRSYYETYITSNPQWEFIGIYFDEGISGLNTKNRQGFTQMINDALDGKIELILTKSISRFARNTVDTLTTIRMLKNKGIGVYFEKENIDTLDSKGEFVLTLMSSLAQEESKSISENVKWSIRKGFSEGKFSVPYSTFYGFKRGSQKYELVIDKEQAKIVRLIFRLYLENNSSNSIMKYLNDNKIPTATGLENWSKAALFSILKNEKHCGDALLQKKYTIDIFLKKQKKNRGEVDQYYIKNSHKGIISKEAFLETQLKIKNTKCGSIKQHLFSDKLLCDCCKNFYNVNKLYYSFYDKPVFKWECSKKYKKQRCKNIILYNEQLHYYLNQEFDTIIEKYKYVFDDLNIILEKVIKK